MTYAEKLKHPKWQKKRLEILHRDKYTCQVCKDTETTLHAHHHYYEYGKDPWDYDDDVYITLCEDCHSREHRMASLLDINWVRAFGKQKVLAGSMSRVFGIILNVMDSEYDNNHILDTLKHITSSDKIILEILEKYNGGAD